MIASIFYFAEQINQLKASLANVRVVDEQNFLECIPNNNAQHNCTEVLCGVSGLADYLGCGKNKAQAIISSRILIDKGIQYKAGAWRFKRKELDALIKSDPLIFDSVKCKRRHSNA